MHDPYLSDPVVPKPREAWRDEPHEACKGRIVLWVTRNGFSHLVLSAATMSGGVISRVACGGGSDLYVRSNTWYGEKTEGRKVCQKCLKMLRQAGENGRIGR